MTNMVPENWKRFGLLLCAFTLITYICTYVSFVYSLLAYFGYLLLSTIVAWKCVKFYRCKVTSKQFVRADDKAVFITGD